MFTSATNLYIRCPHCSKFLDSSLLTSIILMIVYLVGGWILVLQYISLPEEIFSAQILEVNLVL